MLNSIERWMLNRINKKMGVKVTKDNLVLAFNDTNGNGYYKFPKGVELPLSRISKIQEYLMWLSKGVNNEEYRQLLTAMKAACDGGIKDSKGIAKIVVLINELEERAEMVLHDQLFYNIIACQLIRQDESPTDFNNEIQMQKVAEFMKLDKLDDSFFFHIQELLQELGLQNIFKTQYEGLINLSRQTRAAMQKFLSSLSEK